MSRRTALGRKSAAVATLSAVLMVGLAACGSETAEQSGDTLRDPALVFDNVLTVCTDAPYKPFALDVNGTFEGFDIDLARTVADDLDLSMDVIDVDFSDIETGVVFNDDRCDLAVAAISITGERSRVVDFSSPYFASKQALVTPKAGGAASLEGLAGQSVGVQDGTTGETFLRDFAPQTAEIRTFADSGALTDALTSGQVDAAIYDNTVSGQKVKDNANLRVAKEFDTGEQYGMAVKKDGNIPLLRTINGVLADLQSSGEYDKIYKKYF